MVQIALQNGIKQDDLANFMNEVHMMHSAKVVDGVITQEQADWSASANAEYVPERLCIRNCLMQNGQGTPFGPGRDLTVAMQNCVAAWSRHDGKLENTNLVSRYSSYGYEGRDPLLEWTGLCLSTKFRVKQKVS
jgi:hypothetical protein